jgi:hypothetical protein
MSPPKYLEIQKKFEDEVVFTELESKKRKLAQIRELHKPLDHNDMVEHA